MVNTEQHELHIGEVVGERFRVLAYLGGGGFGEVYRMQDLRLQTEVAVKILRAGDRRLPEARADFISEARKQAQLRKIPHVVTIYEAGELEYHGVAFPYIVRVPPRRQPARPPPAAGAAGGPGGVPLRRGDCRRAGGGRGEGGDSPRRETAEHAAGCGGARRAG